MARGGGRLVTMGLIAAVVAAFFVAGTSAQSGCMTVIISLAPCLGFIQGNSSTPPSSCCTQLASVVQSQPRCLCQVLNGGTAPLGIAVNKTQALALPGACKVQTPPVSQCNAAGAGPASSPKDAPAPASPSTPTPSTPAPSSSETPSTPSTPTTTAASPSPAAAGSGSKSTTSGQSSGGSSVKLTLSIFFGALFLTSYASTASIF